MGILKGIIDRFRAMGKTEKEISGIIETAAEAEFIKTHIVDYEKIFDVCMNGDDLEFKKGLVRLQKMQNEYVMQREND